MHWLHAASGMLLARHGFCVSRWTDTSSTASRSPASTLWRLCSWGVKALRRRQARRSCTRATMLRRLARSLVPWSSGDTRRCTGAGVCASARKTGGVALSGPVLRGAQGFPPTALPTGCPISGTGEGAAHRTSQEKQTCHVPVLLGLLVAVLGMPCRGRGRMRGTGPMPDTRSRRVWVSRVPPTGTGG